MIGHRCVTNDPKCQLNQKLLQYFLQKEFFEQTGREHPESVVEPKALSDSGFTSPKASNPFFATE